MTQPNRGLERWDETIQSGMGPMQDAFLDLVRATRDSRHYCDNIIWGNLQTPEYARAVLRLVVDVHETPDDVEAGVSARTARAQFLGQEGRTYHTLLTEQAMRSRLGSADVMRGQLTHLLEALDVSGLTFGLIPARAQLDVYPGNGFSIFDGKRVEVETYSTCFSLTGKEDTALYEKIFVLLERSAVYGQQARDLIEAELRALS